MHGDDHFTFVTPQHTYFARDRQAVNFLLVTETIGGIKENKLLKKNASYYEQQPI